MPDAMNRLSTLVMLAARAQPYRPPVRGGAWKPWYRIENATTDRASVYLYEEIGGWFGVSAQDFVAELNSITASNLDLHINSGGGDVFDAIAIHAALVNHPATVTTLVDGVAASAASFIAMAGTEIGIEKPAQMMIHDARGLTYGSPSDHQVVTDLLHQISDTIAGMYADRAGGAVADWRAAMQANNDNGTWYTSAQAVDAGLADRVLNDSTTAPDDTTSATDQLPGAGRVDARTQMIRARARVRTGDRA